jgi:hypothetical protein
MMDMWLNLLILFELQNGLLGLYHYSFCIRTVAHSYTALFINKNKIDIKI